MKVFKMEIRTVTETMLGSGESLPGIVDNDIRYDDMGIPYMNAKTLKGHLREQMEMIIHVSGDKYSSINIAGLLGSADEDSEKELARLHFSKVGPSEPVRRTIRKWFANNTVHTADEILDALTIVNTYTRIGSNGIVENGSLRTARMFRKGLILESYIYADSITDLEEELLTDAVKALQHIGTMKSKGKGVVECSLHPTGEVDDE